jgi:hypothetical protein
MHEFNQAIIKTITKKINLPTYVFEDGRRTIYVFNRRSDMVGWLTCDTDVVRISSLSDQMDNSTVDFDIMDPVFKPNKLINTLIKIIRAMIDLERTKLLT